MLPLKNKPHTQIPVTSKLKLLSSALSGEAGAMCPLQMWSDALHMLWDEEQSQEHI